MRSTLTRRPFSRTILLLILLLTLLSPALAAPAAATECPPSGTVRWIYDGDSIEVTGIGPVRLLGIDTPEQRASSRDDWFLRQGIHPSTLRRISEKSRNFLIANLKGRTVTLACEQEPRDRYGRLLAYVRLPDGTLINRMLLEKGYAVVYRRFDFTYKKTFLKVEADARRHKRGLWQ
jgi:micrococcal nuclease